MLKYSLELAWHGLRRFPRITLLSVLALALGMGATITARTVTRLLAGDPLPDRSGSLYAVRLDARSSSQLDSSAVNETQVPDKLTWLDVQQLEAERPKMAQTAVVNTGNLKISADTGPSVKKPVKDIAGLEVQSAFFRMFDVPLVAGHAWSHADDAHAVPVAVISNALAHELFGTTRAVGQTMHIYDKLFRVVGVSGHWQPYPHFYGLDHCIYACDAEQVFIPVSAGRASNITLFNLTIGGNCDASHGAVNASKCPYLGMWALLPDAGQRKDYRAMLAHYAETQKIAGRFARGGMAATELQDVSAYLRAHHVVPLTVRFSVWVAVVFLLVCLANVAGLLLTRFMRNARELGIRRALGATRRAVFAQCLLEAGLIGLVGGLLALPLVWAGLWLVAQQPVAYAGVIGMDGTVVFGLLVLSIVASVVVGLVPAWRAAVVEPGLQVKEA